MLAMNGVVKPMRRGGWSARGVIVDIRHGQVFETQIGPMQFPLAETAREWLTRVAAERSVSPDRIILKDAEQSA